ILKKGVCPPNILVRRLNPVLRKMLDESSVRIEVPTENTPLGTRAGARLGLLGAFGYGGTNVHMVVRANDDARPAAAEKATWKRHSPLPWVCPAFIRKNDPSLTEGGTLLHPSPPLRGRGVGGEGGGPAADEPIIDTLLSLLGELVSGEGVQASHSLP